MRAYTIIMLLPWAVPADVAYTRMRRFNDAALVIGGSLADHVDVILVPAQNQTITLCNLPPVSLNMAKLDEEQEQRRKVEKKAALLHTLEEALDEAKQGGNARKEPKKNKLVQDVQALVDSSEEPGGTDWLAEYVDEKHNACLVTITNEPYYLLVACKDIKEGEPI